MGCVKADKDFRVACHPSRFFWLQQVTDQVITKIVDAIKVDSMLCTQVLHLMNRMNLPPPFEHDTRPTNEAKNSKQVGNKRKFVDISLDSPLKPGNDPGAASNSVEEDTSSKRLKVSIEDLQKLNMFKDYTPGVPSRTLFIKNIKFKEANVEELKEYFSMPEFSPVDVKLLDGRLRGQAFVKYSSKEEASQALEATHGTEFHGKPLLVAFSKHA
ncbi:hypothetical protein HDU67_006990 [Dinochytrium kinnereticum]|nr:hypothetical protein HDU67_006990 [Dinochytrium kinnereticum]